MQYSLEAYFLANLAADTALFAVVARANECMRLRRVILSGFLAAFYAVSTKLVSARLEHPAIQLILLAILSMILIGECDIRRWGLIAVQIAGGAMMLGGFGALFSGCGPFPFIILGAGILLVGVILGIRIRRIVSWEITVTIVHMGHCASFRALIDTGNRLREPLSGLPVLIAESRLLNAFPISTFPRRRVSFGALGGSGSMECFRPEAVLIRRGSDFVRAPDVWIAVYPGRIPGPTRALAPPSFAVIPGGM